MSLTPALKQLSGETDGTRELGEREACALLSAMLDGGVAELELGAALALLEQKSVTLAELLGYSTALAQRCSRLRRPAGAAGPWCSPAITACASTRTCCRWWR